MVSIVCGTSKKNRARGESGAIAYAVKAYVVEYSRLPITGMMSDDGSLIKILTGNEPGRNPRNTVFLELEDPKADSLRDPWGEPYRTHLDQDFDGSIQFYGSKIRSMVIVQSAGWDGVFGTDG